MRESVVERTVTERAEAAGWDVRKVQWIGRRGAPDRLFMGRGRFFFVEFKAPGEVPEPHQVREHKRMRGAGIPVHVVDTIEDGLALLR